MRINLRLKSKARRRCPIRSPNANHEFCPQPRLDGYDRDYVKGSAPIVDLQMVSLQVSGADIFFDVTTPKFAAQAINKAAEPQWKPLRILNNVSASVGRVLKPAGLPNSQAIISTAYLKDPSDPQWQNDPVFKQWSDFMKKYLPGGDTNKAFTVYGYSVAQTLVPVLKQCGDDLIRANVMKEGGTSATCASICYCPAFPPTTTRPLSSCG